MTAILPAWNAGGKVTAANTLKQMALNIRRDLTKPIVWETARRIVSQIAERDQVAQAKAIRAWCKARFRYVADPIRVDLQATPAYLLQQIERQGYVMGDCDDAATLTCSLCLAVGIEAQLMAVAFNRPDAPFTHVFTWAYPRGGKPRNMDVSHPDDAPPRAFTRRLTQRV